MVRYEIDFFHTRRRYKREREKRIKSEKTKNKPLQKPGISCGELGVLPKDTASFLSKPTPKVLFHTLFILFSLFIIVALWSPGLNYF